MTTNSSALFGVASFGTERISQYTNTPPLPRNYASRPTLRRYSPISMLGHGHGFSADAPMIQRISIGDSSDDDIPQPMNFSALTKAILEDRPSTRSHSPVVDDDARRVQHEKIALDSAWAKSRVGTPSSRGKLLVVRRSSPPNGANEMIPSPYNVHSSGSRHYRSPRRSLSRTEAYPTATPAVLESYTELVTPVPVINDRATVRRTPSNVSNAMRTSNSTSMAAVSDTAKHHLSGNASSEEQERSSTNGSASRNVQPEGVDSISASTRAKRSLATRSVRGAPMRRPIRRHDEDESPNNEENSGLRDTIGTPHERTPQSEPGKPHFRPAPAHVSVHDFAGKKGSENQLQDLLGSPEPNANHQAATGFANVRPLKPRSPLKPRLIEQLTNVPKYEQPVFKMPALPPALPVNHDQENEPPPTFKKNKPLGTGILGQMEKSNILNEHKFSKMPVNTLRESSPVRQALLPLNINTPQRAAPPPPKMTVLETATATGGASTIKSKKKRSHIAVNGKIFSLRGRLGKGGSAEVYRVMAENDKMFALKKVNLEKCNEETVRGYKGEIELLKRLENVDRVVRLFDWEVNEAKQSLSVLMEVGESDFNRILSTRIYLENATLDLSFTRHFWREMLCCVEAVHAYDIVHSDLKPANFLLVQGRLKLIDFGIANAIDIDNTVNVHRDTNVGTPNYMSPESLQDTNANQRATTGSTGIPGKMMKLGKPSDVWSLGCILYQMTYGKPPFAYIANQWSRLMAIMNPATVISYPATGIGGVSVPNCLRDLLGSCLERDPSRRPTTSQLLDPRERFLNPDRDAERWEKDGAVPMTEHVLEQILVRIVERCRDPKRGVPTDDEVKVYPKAFLDRVRGMVKV